MHAADHLVAQAGSVAARVPRTASAGMAANAAASATAG